MNRNLHFNSTKFGLFKNKPSLLRFVLFFLLVFFNMTIVLAQSPLRDDYSFAQSIGPAYVDMVGGNSVSGPAGASFGGAAPINAASIPIGFNFVFNNASYSTVTISDNGFITFGATLPGTSGAPISAATGYSGAISGFGYNLAGNIALGATNAYLNDGADIKYQTTGSSGSQVFTVEYKNMKRRNLTTNIDGLLNFQIRLYEANMKIEIQYKSWAPPVVTSVLGQVGLRGLTNTDFSNRVVPWATTGAGTLNNDTMGLSNVSGPAANTLFTWTPSCFNPTNLVANLQVDNTTVNFSWTAPAFATASFTAGSSLYNWEVRSSGLPGSGAVGRFSFGSTPTTAASVTGLLPGVSYAFYVKSNCKPWTSVASTAGATSIGTAVTVNSTVGLSVGMSVIATAGIGVFAPGTTIASITNGTQFVVSTAPTTALSGGATVTTSTIGISAVLTPLCSTPVFPYIEDFEGVVVPAIPNCTTVVATTGAILRTTDNTVTPYFGFANKNLITGSVAATDTWFFTRGISLTAGNTYRVSYKYGGSREFSFFNQKMQVKIGTTVSAAGMTTLLADHPNIKSSPITYTFNFVSPGTGVYFMGFNGYASFNQGYLQIDDISLTNPTCFPPTALSSTSITYNSAIVSWTAPASAPSAGYEYYLSTSATAPVATTSVSGAVSGTVTTLSGLFPVTTYYLWVRSNCGGEASIWSVVTSFVTLAAPPTPCTPLPTSVDGTGITNVTFGSINNTTGAEVGNFGNYTGFTTNVAQTQTVPVAITFNTLTYNYNTKIWIDWNNDGVFDNSIGSQELVYTGLSGTTSPNTLSASFTVPISVTGVANTAGPHRLRIGGADIDLLAGTLAGQGPCYTGSFGTFEDYSIYVTSPPPALTLSSTSTSYCSGGSSPLVTLTAGAGSYNSFVWNPSVGVTGSALVGWTFNPTTAGTLTYILTATQASGLFLSNTATYTITVYDKPSPIVFAPSTISACDGVPTALTSSGGIISGALIFEENFNSSDVFTRVLNAPTVPYGPWIANNTSVGGANLAPAWTLKTSPYIYSSTTFVSNDASQFIISNSDAQGSGTTTNTELISPLITFAGYTNVSLSYWQYYRGFGSGIADTQVWRDVNGNGLVDGSESITSVKTFSTASDGTASGFVKQVIDLSAFAGQTNIRLRFQYSGATWAWYWAVDNVKITGSGTAALSWSPTTGLYTDAAGLVAYVGGAVSAIYAKLSSNQTYTATATSPSPPFCDTSSTLTVNVTKAGVAAGDQSLSCGNTNLTSNITLTGYAPAVLGTIAGWQMDDNPGFTSPTDITGSAGKDILTPGDVGSLSGVTYFRAKITGCSTVYSNTVTATFTNSKTWNGVVWVPAGTPGSNDNVTVSSGTLNITADMSVCNFRVSTGATVNVDPGVTLTVSGAVVVSTFGAGGTLLFKSDPTFVAGTASLMQDPASTTNVNTGIAKYERWTKTRKFDYTYWSSPLFPCTLQTVSPFTLADKYLRFDSNAYAWTFPVNTSTMVRGVGYAIRGPQTYDNITLTNFKANFSGTPNNGNYDVVVFKSGSNDLNFLGNPYASALSADLLMDGNVGPLGTAAAVGAGGGTTFYFWTHNTQYNGGAYPFSDYASYNKTGGTLGSIPTAGVPGANNAPPNGIISAGQGFMVRAVTAGTVTFRNNMRVAGNNLQFFRLQNNSDKSRIWLNYTNMNNTAEFKQVLVGYIPNATNEYEDGYDGEVIEAGSSIGFYSLVEQDGKHLVIQGRGLPFAATDLVPLGYRATAASTYEISLSDKDGLFADDLVGIYLEDTLLNVIHDLRQSPYQFVTEAGTFNSRFVLRYNNGFLAINPVDFNENNVVVFKQNDQIHVETSLVKMKSVRIFDLQGRLIIEKNNINSQSAMLQHVGLANQVLMVQITSVDGSVVSKKIIF